ncbi:hypothetical protein Tco_0711740 [Tanacetum coccineum]
MESVQLGTKELRRRVCDISGTHRQQLGKPNREVHRGADAYGSGVRRQSTNVQRTVIKGGVERVALRMHSVVVDDGGLHEWDHSVHDDTNLQSPSKHPDKRGSLDAPAKLTRAKLKKRSGDADLSGLESPLELQRSWCVEGHIPVSTNYNYRY